LLPALDVGKLKSDEAKRLNYFSWQPTTTHDEWLTPRRAKKNEPSCAAMEPSNVCSRFAGIDWPEILFHIAILSLAVLGILISLGGIAFLWVWRKTKTNRLT
jgi:hypothetical protein